MTMPKDEIRSEMQKAWQAHVNGLEKSLNILEKEIDDAGSVAEVCTGEWCEATEHMIDELNNSLFSISEPRWGNPEDTTRIKELKKRLYNMYANYRQVYQKAGNA